jgi:hypothetical protein
MRSVGSFFLAVLAMNQESGCLEPGCMYQMLWILGCARSSRPLNIVGNFHPASPYTRIIWNINKSASSQRWTAAIAMVGDGLTGIFLCPPSSAWYGVQR